MVCTKQIPRGSKFEFVTLGSRCFFFFSMLWTFCTHAYLTHWSLNNMTTVCSCLFYMSCLRWKLLYIGLNLTGVSLWGQLTWQYLLTHWGWVTNICVRKPTIIGSDNGLSPGRRQAIIRTNAGILLIGTLGTNFSEILSEIHTFSFKKMHLKMSSGK